MKFTLLLPLAGLLMPASATDENLGPDLFWILRNGYQIESRLENHPGSSVLATGRQFLGRPYRAGSLDADNAEERLVARCDGFDCLTFIENSVAIMHSLRSNDRASYPANLEKLRYRAGKRDGYASRLHYFTDWILDNAALGLVRDITAELGGIPDARPIHFMTTNRGSYQALADDRLFQALKRVEARLTQEKRFYIPKAEVAAVVPKLECGDIIAITTGIDGLDVSHVGLVYRNPKGEVHLLHATRSGGSVQVTRLPLAAYLADNPSMTGIKVARPL